MTLILADVSEFQGVINWKAYGAANPAVIVRAHNGYRADYQFSANLSGARANCTWTFFYQYLNAGQNPIAAAQAMTKTIGPLRPGEGVIVDIETGDGNLDGVRAAWINAMQETNEWTYSGAYFARAHLPNSPVEWIASYGSGEPSIAHLLWQFTDRRSFAGIAAPCDASAYNGTIDELLAATHGTVVPPPIPHTTSIGGPMRLIQGPTRGIALIGLGYFKLLYDPAHATPATWESVTEAIKIVGSPIIGNDRQFDVWKETLS